MLERESLEETVKVLKELNMNIAKLVGEVRSLRVTHDVYVDNDYLRDRGEQR